MKKLSKKLVAVVTLAVSMAAMPAAFALNESGDGAGGGQKAVDFVGYEYVDSTHVDVYFSKQTGVTADPSMFSFQLQGSGTTIDVSSINQTNASRYTKQELDGGGSDVMLGTKMRLNLASPLSAGQRYNVTIKHSVMDNNGMSLGNYHGRKDLIFAMRVPSGGSYGNTTPIATFWVGDHASPGATNPSNVSYESPVTVILDRPIASSDLSTFLSSLNTGYRNGANAVNLDYTIMGDPNDNTDEAYDAHANEVNGKSSTFFFPMTKLKSTTEAQNRLHDTGYNYTVNLPDLTGSWLQDDLGNNITAWKNYSGSTISNFTFSTASSDYPGFLDRSYLYAASTGDSAGQMKVSFYNSTITPSPAGYYLAYTSSANSPWSSANSWTIRTTESHTGGTNVVFGDSGGAIPAGTYYIRLVPHDSSGRMVGMSSPLGNTSPTTVTVI